MTRQWDYKRDEKELYLPRTTPQITDIPPMWFAMLDGQGNPNGEEFAACVEALYSLTYAVKMSYRGDSKPAGYVPYTVYPLEGVWDLVDYSKPASDKENLKYRVMIRQPGFVTPAVFEDFRFSTMKKKPHPLLAEVRFAEMTDGLSCQALHLGPFDLEQETFRRMERYCSENGFARASKVHREIYLSDPRKTEPVKLKTVLRFGVTALSR